MPVVPRKSTFANGSSYFRDMFSIPNNKHIIVYSGNFMPWAQCLEIIQSMSDWPESAVLVMHTWNEAALSSKYFSLMQETAKGRPVHFSNTYLNYGDLPKALASADIGLLFYESIDTNFTDIMFSSNKLGEYMAAGLPIIGSPFPSLQSFVEKHGIGKCVLHTGIGSSIKEILQNKHLYKENVALCRHALFDFDTYFTDAYSALYPPSSFPETKQHAAGNTR